MANKVVLFILFCLCFKENVEAVEIIMDVPVQLDESDSGNTYRTTTNMEDLENEMEAKFMSAMMNNPDEDITVTTLIVFDEKVIDQTVSTQTNYSTETNIDETSTDGGTTRSITSTAYPDVGRYSTDDIIMSRHAIDYEETTSDEATSRSLTSTSYPIVHTTANIIEPTDCRKFSSVGGGTSEIFIISINSMPTEVYCDLETDDGGWIIFLNIGNDEQENFNIDGNDYEHGFRYNPKQFWLGLENLHKITSNGNYELRVEYKNGNTKTVNNYSTFKVRGARDNYKITVGYVKDNDSIFLCQDDSSDKFRQLFMGTTWTGKCHPSNLPNKFTFKGDLDLNLDLDTDSIGWINIVRMQMRSKT